MTSSRIPFLLAVTVAAVAAGSLLAVRPLDPTSTVLSNDKATKRSPADAKSASNLARPVALAERPLQFGRDVRPILSDRCFLCHGPDREHQKAGLRLDNFADATAPRDGGAAIVPGDPDASELWRRITSHDPELVMPTPASNKKQLSDAERAIIRRWIEEGARYENHWAFVAPAASPAPEVRRTDGLRNEIDRFIEADLERSGFTMSPEAAPETLVRRVYLDLTGLPPTPAETDAYLADTRADRYERLIDRLLTEEPYATRTAERLSVPWLDMARYADTNGIHMDAGRQMWLWRDWVIDALRANKPYDRFIVEQLAGDLLPDATIDQRIASGFNRAHVITDEGGAINEEYLLEYAVDRVNTTGTAFLGLSVGCARCHDHKFDPITTEDFYSLIAFFNSNEEPGLYSQAPDPNRAFEPFLEVPRKDAESRLSILSEAEKAAREAQAKAGEGERAELDAFVADVRRGFAPVASSVLSAKSAAGATFTTQPDGSVLASGENPADDEHTIVLRTDGTNLRLLMLEALTDPSHAGGGVGRAFNGNAVLDHIAVEAVSVADPSRREPVELTWAWADYEQENGDYRVVNALTKGEGRQWAVRSHEVGGQRTALFAAAKPFGFDGGTELHVTLTYRSPYANHIFGRVRFTPMTATDEALAQLPEARSGWYIAGPFFGEPGAGYTTAYGPETATRFDRQARFRHDDKKAGPQEDGWRYAPGVVDGAAAGLAASVGSEFLARQIYAPSARKLDLSFGSDDGIQVYLNGKLVHENRTARAVAPDQERISVELVPGENFLVCKVVNTGGQAGFYARHVPPAELAMPRETFVMKRGLYDQPDKSRPVTRAIPAVFGRMPEDLPKNRLGLAEWLVSDDNPLTSRVVVNRVWEMLFGNGLVRTSDDFGLQGEWPTHPELLDTLSVRFREGGWNLHALLREVLSSATYRQESRVRPELAGFDPGNRLLGFYPRQRLAAEQIRDQALYVGGLLVEKPGGPSVKPYQPENLWQEVAMLQSNTRVYEQGMGEDLWRRSMYTYWKRAAPPPSMLTFDAPTREFCTPRRLATNTPLQALVLWNDPQFVEAARAAAERTLREQKDDAARIELIYRRATGEAPSERARAAMVDTLARNRERYAAAPMDAEKLVSVGYAPRSGDIEAAELAAWTMLVNAVLSSDGTIVKD
ncbi:MAG: PSD1 and planctomycete cytochrome C domain-containing protein [Planctomycetaceae bacterium]|nr:PSD1 and planctomycete cytochrome C domain-containing protein [Planctomycetaceae bacterium]